MNESNQFRLRYCKNYPLQNNGYDCGVYTLLGIENFMKNSNFETFFNDINEESVTLYRTNMYNTLKKAFH